MILDPPIEVERKGSNNDVKVILKGGFSLNTKKYNLSWKNNNVGIILSVNGIPYFELDFHSIRGGFEPYRTLCCMVAECDQMDVSLNIDRTWYKEDHISENFELALKEALRARARARKTEQAQSYNDLNTPQKRSPKKPNPRGP